MQPPTNIADKIVIFQLLADHPPHNVFHQPDGVEQANVMSTCKLGYITVKVFVADFVECAFVSAFQYAPKRFHSVDVDLLIDIFANTMLNMTMVVSVQILITHEVVDADS